MKMLIYTHSLTVYVILNLTFAIGSVLNTPHTPGNELAHVSIGNSNLSSINNIPWVFPTSINRRSISPLLSIRPHNALADLWFSLYNPMCGRTGAEPPIYIHQGGA